MEVEFVYHITGNAGLEDLEAAASRAHTLNANIGGYQVEADGDDITVRIRSKGHDRTAVARRLVAPIRAIFHRAGIATSRITLYQQTVLPNGRHKTAEQGRTPAGTFHTAEIHQMIGDAAMLDSDR